MQPDCLPPHVPHRNITHTRRRPNASLSFPLCWRRGIKWLCLSLYSAMQWVLGAAHTHTHTDSCVFVRTLAARLSPRMFPVMLSKAGGGPHSGETAGCAKYNSNIFKESLNIFFHFTWTEIDICSAETWCEGGAWKRATACDMKVVHIQIHKPVQHSCHWLVTLLSEALPSLPLEVQGVNRSEESVWLHEASEHHTAARELLQWSSYEALQLIMVTKQLSATAVCLLTDVSVLVFGPCTKQGP